MHITGVGNNSYNFNGQERVHTSYQPASNKKKTVVGLCCVSGGSAIYYRKPIKEYLLKLVQTTKKLKV